MLAGCGLQPMYAGGGSGAVARALSDVAISPVEGQSGWLVRNAVADRLGAGAQSEGTRYRLDIRLDDKVEGLGQLSNDTITRERRTLRARYQLVDQQSGAVLLDATAGSDAGFDVVNSEYAVIAAEQTALENLAQEVADQIVTRISVRLSKSR
ncbi:MAG: LPS assembly lipoprotein LptE [Novosphingobium sp.]|nr:LPS assembly lipoprotein LptE [Novosphingobium sp.]